MVTQYRKGNRFTPTVGLAEAAVDWQGLSAEQQELVVIQDDGLPFLAGVPDLTERAEALLHAAQGKYIAGATHNEDGYPLHASRMALDRKSVAKWIAAAEGAAPPKVQASLANESDDLVQIDEVCQILGIGRKPGGGRSTLSKLRSEGRFPEPTHTNPLRWPRSMVLAARDALAKNKSPARPAEEDI